MRRSPLILAAVLCLALAAGLIAGAPAVAQAQGDCLPAGGASIPDATSAQGDYVFSGGGWGHGVGMSQYGAMGAARLGCDVGTILSTYYPGVSVEAAEMTPIRVSLWPDRPNGSMVTVINVVAVEGPIPWRLTGEAGDAPEVPDQPAGELWAVWVTSEGGYRILRDGDDGSEEVWSGGSSANRLRAEHDGKLVRLTSKGNRRYKHGALEFSSQVIGGAAGMFVTADVPSIDTYLRGLAEMPSSWPEEALKAQAVTGRSYAVGRRTEFNGNRQGCRCDLYDSVWDQAWTGYEKEAETSGGTHWGARWVAAVAGTAGKVMRHDGQVAVGYYSSSHGGHSESNRFVWGGDEEPYLQPVDDSRWELATDGANGRLRWSTGVSAERLAEVFKVGEVRSVTTPEPKGAAGRIGHPDRGYGGLRVEGSTGTVTVSGEAARTRLGLNSSLFTVSRGDDLPDPPTSDPCLPVNGDAFEELVERVSGPERIATATAVSEREWNSAPDVLVATAYNYPDALASGSLSATLDAPLLLTAKDELPAGVGAELDRLGARNAWILGGTAAVSDDVEEQLRDLGLSTRRVAGGNRFETARAIAVSPHAATRPVVALVGADDWPAAVAAGALAASPDRVPTLLTHVGEVPEVTVQTLEDLQTETVLVVGGRSAISSDVEEQLQGLGYEVERLAGQDRYETSQVVAERALDSSEGGRAVVLATGKDFPDALTAGGLAARLAGTLVLAPHCNLDEAEPIRGFLRERRERLDRAVIVGGASAVSERVREQVAEALNGD